MSVRDKIAGFGGAATATTTRPSISSRPGSRSTGFSASNPRIGTDVSASSFTAVGGDGGGGADAAVRKLKVPDVFKNATKPADVPLAVAAANGAVGHPSSSSSSSAQAKKWGAPSTGKAAGASNGAGVSALGGPANANGRSNGGGALQWKAPSGAGTASRTTKRAGSDDVKKPRDVLGIGAVMSSGSSSSSRSAPAADNRPAPAARTGSSSSRSGGGSGDLSGRESPTGRSDKPKAGPRKLNLTRISAEKQRAALCLDKNLDEENDDGGTLRPDGAAVSVGGAAKPANGAGASFSSSSSSSYSSGSYSKPTSSSYSKPASIASSRSAGGGGARSGGAAKVPSAGSLRSSGHNLW